MLSAPREASRRNGALRNDTLRNPVALLASLCLLMGLAACSSQALRWPSADNYTVKQGDTLYSIAWRHGLDFRVLAQWNNLSTNDIIYPGQVLRLSAPASGPDIAAGGQAPRSAPEPPSVPAPSPPSPVGEWRWPASGELAVKFGQRPAPGQARGTGIDITGVKGSRVVAAAAGSVVYAGSGLIGLGKLIIIKHNKTYLSAYGHNSELLVAEGDEVSAGQTIGKMGIGSGNRALLHFEIRQNGEPVDPLKYLPQK